MKLYLVEEKYKYNSKTSWPLSSISIYFTGQNVNIAKRAVWVGSIPGAHKVTNWGSKLTADSNIDYIWQIELP